MSTLYGGEGGGCRCTGGAARLRAVWWGANAAALHSLRPRRIHARGVAMQSGTLHAPHTSLHRTVLCSLRESAFCREQWRVGTV